MSPLSGIRIVDLTAILMGPYATQFLADYGADVVKVESMQGDLVRDIGPMRSPQMGPIFLNVNRSKRSIAVDLKTPEGRGLLLDLCRDADVLVYNIRPAAMARLGLSYEEVAGVNPRIIYAGCYGYGQDGPYAANPAYDDLIQGGACLPYLYATASGQEPRYVPAALADRIVGLTILSGILAALVARNTTGEGQRVDVPMFETMVNVIMSDHLGGLTFEEPLDEGGYHRQMARDRRPYKTSDGYVCALIYTDKHWRRFLDAVGYGDRMDTDPRYATFTARTANIDTIYAELTEIFLSRTSAEWVDLFNEIDVPVMWMHDFRSVLEDEHLQAVGFFRKIDHPTEGRLTSMANPVKLSATPVAEPRPVPRLGEQTVEILQSLGRSQDEIDSLIARKIVRAAAPEPSGAAVAPARHANRQ
ncbi:CoA transferase [Acuticoccus sediminis]|uniref:CoA transferase n=1 Tax=Acuticoccus sediminis TaxID=2184697 RepID=A0A8B2NKX8_9HYPH|nr:CoA transferase [Acuticoccus sediminis]RAH96805.1 CoA transferase [Acuticoccus sediminis]